LNDGDEVNFIDLYLNFYKQKISSGETVTKDEQINLLEPDEILSTTQSMISLSTVTSSAFSPTSSIVNTVAAGIPLGGLDTRSTNPDEWEKERSALYQQLDEKVIERIY